MMGSAANENTQDLVLDYELDAPPEKVWRAISNPALRERWLPKAELAEAAPLSSTPGEEVRYRMREDEPPFLESVVTLQVRPNPAGGTTLRIIHRLADVTLKQRVPQAANSNRCCLMRAA
jgi:uncharacterized protein YndB with AHSA1/START domain